MKIQQNQNIHCQFASDNYAGICPEAWQAMEDANEGYVLSYGEDEWTELASNKIRELFNTACDVYFVFNGTAANSLALASLCHSYHSIICHETAHIETDECGAPEFFSNGTKLLLVPGENGKVDLPSIERLITRRSDIHFPRPKVLSVTQSTELGTVYNVEELRAIGEISKKYNLKVHMDGARFANAVAALNVHPSEITWKAGVDVLCFGGTKNGMAYGEAVIFFDRELSKEFDYRCKQAGQLSSKMRFLASPWVRMLEKSAWIKNAKNANQSAKVLREKLSNLNGIEFAYKTEANAVFVRMPDEIFTGLKKKGWHFYGFIGNSCYRLMCSWKTNEEDINRFVNDLRELL